ncbi:MAG: methyltransferase [Muribaculaceae bacterium]|nr:methyltransferase [Muribaculaceae bacterium]
MQSERFEFKKFGVNHGLSSMKVGIDSILLGCWTDVKTAKKILDVGTGCGILALMCAQRNPDAIIEGIDLDAPSIKEAEENFKASPWGDRISAILSDFLDCKKNGYDLIISNPPFFNSGVNKIVNSRERARHQDTLSPKILIEKGRRMLTSTGIISMIVPYQQKEELIQFALSRGLKDRRCAMVKGRRELSPKRILLEFENSEWEEGNECLEEEIILESSLGNPSEEFKFLCKDFYLNF